VIDYPALCAIFDAPSASSLAALNLDSTVEWDRLNSFSQNPKLRKWQAEALPAALCSIYARRAGVVAATTGAGKSVLQAELIRLYLLDNPDHRVVVTAPSIRLVDQLADTFSSWLPSGCVGKWYTHGKQGGRQVTVACNPSAVALAQHLAGHGIVADLWIADECHKTECATFGVGVDVDVERAGFPSKARLGFTATPFRANAKATVQLFDTVTYRYPPAEAMRDGAIVDFEIIPWDETRAPVATDEACVTMIRELGDQRGPGVVNASTIQDAEEYCAVLEAAGFKARALHSRMTTEDKNETVDALRSGAIDMIVHVAMLVEGVDFPWLRWICLRRQVRSRVRFIQEVGRVLRASPGKDKARVLDPNDLFGEFQLTYADALGLLFNDSDPDELELEAETEEDKECKDSDKPPEEVQSARTTALGRYVREIRLALLAEGIAKDSKQPAGRLWREHAPTAKQLGWIEKLKGFLRYVCIEHSAALQQLLTSPNLTKGIVCDMIDILCGLKDGLEAGKLPKEWAPSMKIRIPCSDAFMPVLVAPGQPVPVYVTGMMTKELAFIALVRRGEVLYFQAREKRKGDNWTRLTVSAIKLAVSQYHAEEVVTHDQAAFDTFSGPQGCEGVGVRLCKQPENPSVGPAFSAAKRYSVSE
jgi:superfamily II DNA or RNA helicase